MKTASMTWLLIFDLCIFYKWGKVNLDSPLILESTYELKMRERNIFLITSPFLNRKFHFMCAHSIRKNKRIIGTSRSKNRNVVSSAYLWAWELISLHPIVRCLPQCSYFHGDLVVSLVSRIVPLYWRSSTSYAVEELNIISW